MYPRNFLVIFQDPANIMNPNIWKNITNDVHCIPQHTPHLRLLLCPLHHPVSDVLYCGISVPTEKSHWNLNSS